MASKKGTAAKVVSTDTAPALVEGPKPTAATKELDKEAPQHVFRVDMGQAIETPPIRTATDNETKKK
jgi:hypothetical protein